MQDAEFHETIELIHKEDGRYDKRAYHFVRAGLDFTVKEIKRHDPDRSRKTQHVSGPELLEGLRTYALDQYGPLALRVLNDWGVRRCQDFGEIVFNLIEYNVLSKTEKDQRTDFSDCYDFSDVFLKPFEPKRRRLPPLNARAETREE